MRYKKYSQYVRCYIFGIPITLGNSAIENLYINLKAFMYCTFKLRGSRNAIGQGGETSVDAYLHSAAQVSCCQIVWLPLSQKVPDLHDAHLPGPLKAVFGYL